MNDTGITLFKKREKTMALHHGGLKMRKCRDKIKIIRQAKIPEDR